MKAWIVMMVALVAFDAHAEEPASATVSLTWQVSLDAAGRVTHLSTTDTRVPKLHSKLAEAIRGWRFTAGKIEGQPAPTDTWLTTTIELKMLADTVEIRCVYAGTGSTYLNAPPPRYPDAALSARKQGLVVLLVEYDGTGAITAAAPYEHAPKPFRLFADSATRAVRKWTMAPEVVGGHPLPGKALIPVCFTISGYSDKHCAWADASRGTTESGSGSIALNPAAKLESDVIGRTL